MTSASFPDSSELAERRIGDVVAGKWRLERVLGVGGMAAVYAARHTNNLRQAALKLLHPELAANADIRRRFLREGYFANKIGHPGAVAILDDGVDGGDIFLVMELLEGESLASRRDQESGGMGVADTLRIAEQLLDVLAAAHAAGIVHRDLKPDNVFLMKDGSVKVLDFGIARLLDRPGGEDATNTGVMMGTPQYMPPEQARGRVKLIDARSDIFAVGAIVFAVLSGRHVHEAESPTESLLRAMTTPAPSLRSVVPRVSPRTALVVDRALAFEQGDRWQDARAMQAAVREALAEIDEDPASSIALAPTQLSVGKVAPAVTRAPTPVVNDVRHPRSSGGRLALVILSLGAGAAAATLVARSPLFAHVSTGGSASVMAPPPMPSSARAVALEIGDASLSDAAARDDQNAPAPETSVADAAIDALGQDTDASADADTEEDDDDGGDDEEVLFDAGRAAVAVGRAGGHATHKEAPPPVRKRHHKKRVKR